MPEGRSRKNVAQKTLKAHWLALAFALAVSSCNAGTENATPSDTPQTEAKEAAGEKPKAAAPKARAQPRALRDRVILKPAADSENFFERDLITARAVFRAAPIEQLIRYAYDVHPRDIILEAPLSQDRIYDALVEPADRNRETVRKLLRERLEEEFNIEATFVERDVPILLLRRTSDTTELPAATSRNKRVIGGLERFEGRRASMADIARFMRTLSERPVIDQTGLEGEYDIVVEWNADDGREAFVEAFSKVGLELEPSFGSAPHLLIQRPEPAAQPRPSAD